MDLLTLFKVHLMIFFSLLCLHARADGSRSIVFLDSPDHHYLRSHPSDDTEKISLISLPEVASAVSVLLGFAPEASLPDNTFSKLDEVLSPNPFDRPHAVFMLEVSGIEGELMSQNGNMYRGSIGSPHKAEIPLSDGDEISVVPLDEPLGECGTACIDNKLHDLANWFGGSYMGASDGSDGKLNIPLASGTSIDLHLSKEADREFVLSLVSLIHNVKKAIEMHEDFAESHQSPSELLTGSFTGIEALKQQYGPGNVVQQGMELFQATLTKLFDSLLASYKGKIVGVILSSEKSSLDSAITLDMKHSSRASRWLEEEVQTNVIIHPEILLARRSLAWVTGIILLVSTLIGVYLLVNMPLTRDTLLYSNVKLD
ncbi:hypothetical protein QJS10_CPB21g00101 [Acorus calamus]|uniref:DUF7794 domain-containing protein n=1 Tax=Acorus calamus TaxID=4465 RepID=A0AAV9C5I8_ACOCL|nr:hypothetical protein QJS10_CPB21g00101 [Acorus calamus]